MTSDWAPSTVGEFCPFVYGKGLPARDRKQHGAVPVVSSAGVISRHDKAYVNGPGIVVGRKGTVGSLTLMEKPFWPIDTAFFVRDEPSKRNLFFTYYLLKTLGLESMNTDSAVPGLNRDNAHKLCVSVPPFSVQERIGAFAKSLDHLIQNFGIQNSCLESIAQTLFRSWFVDFDPVHANVSGKEPEAMSAELAKLFPSEFEVSELGKIPKGWIASTVGQAFEINPRRKLAKGIRAPFLDMANVQTKGHRPEQHLDMREFGSGTKFINGDTLLARITPCLENGKTAFVDFLKNGEVAGGSTEFIVLRSKDGRPLYWSYLLARFEPFRKHSIKAMTGTSGRQRVDVETLMRFPFICPSDELAKAVAPLFDSLHRLIAGNTDVMLALTELRDQLLPRLILGKLHIEDAEASVATITSARETEPA